MSSGDFRIELFDGWKTALTTYRADYLQSVVDRHKNEDLRQYLNSSKGQTSTQNPIPTQSQQGQSGSSNQNPHPQQPPWAGLNPWQSGPSSNPNPNWSQPGGQQGPQWQPNQGWQQNQGWRQNQGWQQNQNQNQG